MTDPHNTFVDRAAEDITNMFFREGARVRKDHNDIVKAFLLEAIEQGREEGRREMREKLLKSIPDMVHPLPKEFPLEHTQGRNFAYNEIREIVKNLWKS